MNLSALDNRGPAAPTLRAATTLVPQLHAAASVQVANVWRADEFPSAESAAGCATTGFATLDQELPGRGWPRGQLVELLVEHPGVGELGLLLPALADLRPTGRSCVWVLPCPEGAGPSAGAAPEAATKDALPYAPVLTEAGIDLASHIFVKPLTARESAWALEQSLRTAHLGALIGWLPESTGADADFRGLRRLHLLAQRHRALVFVVRSARHAHAPSPAALRLQLHHRDGQLQVQVLKRRGRPLLEPVALQVHPARWNRAPAATPATATPQTQAVHRGSHRPARPSPLWALRQVMGALSPQVGTQRSWPVPADVAPSAAVGLA